MNTPGLDAFPFEILRLCTHCRCAYIAAGRRQFYPRGRSARTMHPGQNNSLKPLWSVQDKGFIIDLRLIVTLWITRVCTVRYALAYFLRLYKQRRIPFSRGTVRSIAHFPANANRTGPAETPGNSRYVASRSPRWVSECPDENGSVARPPSILSAPRRRD